MAIGASAGLVSGLSAGMLGGAALGRVGVVGRVPHGGFRSRGRRRRHHRDDVG